MPCDHAPLDATPRFGLSVAEMAQYLGVQTKTLRRWVRTKGFPKPHKITRKTVRFDLVEVQLWLRRQRQA
jgi:excisionase family DNA binding protein